MKCIDCQIKKVVPLEDAEWILWDSALNKYTPLCQGCLDDYIHFEGENNLDFWLLDGIKSGMSTKVFLSHVNEIIRGKERQKEYLYKRMDELKNGKKD